MPIGFSLIIVAIIWLWVSDQAIAMFGGIPRNQALWETGWRIQAGDADTRDLRVPMRLMGQENSIINVLPNELATRSFLYIKTNFQAVRVEVAGQPLATHSIAASGTAHFTSDMPWTVIPLENSMAGQPIRLTFSNTGSKPFIEITSIRCGTQARVQLALLRSSMVSLTQSMLMSIIALALFMYASMEARRFRQRIDSGYAYLLALVLVSGAWFYTYTDISAVSYPDSIAFHVGNVGSYFILPPIFILFSLSTNKAYHRQGYVLLAITLVSLSALFVLWYYGLIALWVAEIGLVSITSVYCVGVAWLSWRRRLTCQHGGMLQVGIAVMAASGIITICAITFWPLYDDTVFMRHAMLALLVTLTMSVLDANASIIVKARRFEQLRIREEEYNIAVRQSNQHVVRFDVRSRAILQSGSPTPLFGDAPTIPNLPESAIERGIVSAESVADFKAFFASMLAGKPKGTMAARLRNFDGSYAWYRADFTMIYADEGDPLQAVITCLDITTQREKELAYQKWKQSYAEMPAGSMTYYEYNLTRDAFEAEAGKMLPPLPPEVKRTLGTMVDYLADNHVLPADDQKFRAFFQRDRLLTAFSQGIQSGALTFRRMRADGQPLWTQANVQLVPDPYANDVQAFLLLKDDDERMRGELLVHARSVTDSLTGLLNRAAFEERANDLLATQEPGGIHALLMIDVDGFKRVNDTYGHHFGDRVLVDVAASLQAMMRSDDLVGRLGGDEYVVCLKNVREGTGFLERRSAFICQALSKQFDVDVSITGSIGLALYPRDGRTFDELYRKADTALYYAKHHGKNRYVFYHKSLEDFERCTPVATTLPATCAPPQAAPHAPKRTLLVVDDVEMNRALLGDLFEAEYNMLFAENGQQCLDILMRSEAAISAVLLDLIMPGLGGLKVLERIQSDAYMATIPVIVISAADEMEYSLKAIELGATDFVSKPLDARLVHLRVTNAVHKRETEELRAQNRYLLVQKNDENRHQDELRYMAEHDPLTNISNKATFYRKTKAMLEQAPTNPFVMIALDIERFRLINDIFGHEEGDRLLHYIAQRMQALYGGQGTYSRIDADNFALCLPYDQAVLLQRFMANEAELKEYDLPFDIVLVYGLYIIDDRTLPVSIMHDRAEMAKRTVKGNYVQRYAYYDDALRKSLLDELDIVNNMDAALQLGQFEVYLQPKCRLDSGQIVGAEALVRWNHPKRGVLAPGAFVPIFERNGFIMKLDAWVWEQVCQLLRKWMDQNGGVPRIPVSMNVSRVSVYNPTLVNTLSGLADRYGLPHSMLELEITESAYAEDPKQLYSLVSELRTRGFPVQMDDFGSAYSSLNMLKEISVDLLKLDMRFLYGNDHDGRGGTILSSVVRMARYLALPIVVEGVETAEQARFLHSIGLAVAQGYYYHKPMPIRAFEQLLAQNSRKPIGAASEPYPEASVRRVWSINGDFSLMLSTIPCAATLCEMNSDTIEILRINDEYLAMTRDRLERIYTKGTDVRTLTTPQNHAQLLTLFRQSLAAKSVTTGEYTRLSEDGTHRRYLVKITYLSGDAIRALFFITYNPLVEACQ